MNEESIREAWELLKGGEPPERFMAIVARYRNYKNFNGDTGFDSRDFAICLMFFSIDEAYTKMASRRKSNG